MKVDEMGGTCNPRVVYEIITYIILDNKPEKEAIMKS
jgi:hypothetical protein